MKGQKKIIMIGTTEIFLAINSNRKMQKKKPPTKREKHKEPMYKTFDQVIEKLLLSETIFTKKDSDTFYIFNDDVIIESFNDITL